MPDIKKLPYLVVLDHTWISEAREKGLVRGPVQQSLLDGSAPNNSGAAKDTHVYSGNLLRTLARLALRMSVAGMPVTLVERGRNREVVVIGARYAVVEPAEDADIMLAQCQRSFVGRSVVDGWSVVGFKERGCCDSYTRRSEAEEKRRELREQLRVTAA